MTASFGQSRVVVHLAQVPILFCSVAALLLGGYAFASGWFDWASLFRSHPLLSIPCSLSLFVAPALLYIRIRQITENGVRGQSVLSAVLSAAATGLTAFGLFLWLRNVAG